MHVHSTIHCVIMCTCILLSFEFKFNTLFHVRSKCTISTVVSGMFFSHVLKKTRQENGKNLSLDLQQQHQIQCLEDNNSIIILLF